jgi:hypothetical protein
MKYNLKNSIITLLGLAFLIIGSTAFANEKVVSSDKIITKDEFRRLANGNILKQANNETRKLEKAFKKLEETASRSQKERDDLFDELTSLKSKLVSLNKSYDTLLLQNKLLEEQIKSNSANQENKQQLSTLLLKAREEVADIMLETEILRYKKELELLKGELNNNLQRQLQKNETQQTTEINGLREEISQLKVAQQNMNVEHKSKNINEIAHEVAQSTANDVILPKNDISGFLRASSIVSIQTDSSDWFDFDSTGDRWVSVGSTEFSDYSGYDIAIGILINSFQISMGKEFVRDTSLRFNNIIDASSDVHLFHSSNFDIETTYLEAGYIAPLTDTMWWEIFAAYGNAKFTIDQYAGQDTGGAWVLSGPQYHSNSDFIKYGLGIGAQINRELSLFTRVQQKHYGDVNIGAGAPAGAKLDAIEVNTGIAYTPNFGF